MPATTYTKLKNVRLNERSQIKKRHILYNSFYIKCPVQTNPQRQKVDLWFLGTERRSMESDY